MSPKVSICCITFNHGPYIRQCLDSFLMQKTDFPIEILIYDDASTDDTQEIIREYQDKYPEIIKPVLQTENQYSQGVRGISPRFNFTRAQGKYIAMCEGDDYWTDPMKLQTQVDFLEKNQEYILTCHDYIRVDENNNIISENNFSELLDGKELYSFDSLSYFDRFVTQPCTIMFESKYFYSKAIEKYKYYRDKPMFYEILKNSQKRGALLNLNAAAYRIHSGGVYSSIQKYKLRQTHYQVNFEIFNINKKLLKGTTLHHHLQQENIQLLKQAVKEENLPMKKELLKNAKQLFPLPKLITIYKNFYR